MTIRCNPITRAVALLILTLALCSIPSALHAQVDLCRCDHYTIAVDAGVNCKLSICYQLSPLGPTICTVIGPGSTGQIPCPVYQATIITCRGSSVIIDNNPAVARCTPDLQIATDCCVRGCRGLDPRGCSLMTFTAVPCLTRCQ